jgi:hypothetical protein
VSRLHWNTALYSETLDSQCIIIQQIIDRHTHTSLPSWLCLFAFGKLHSGFRSRSTLHDVWHSDGSSNTRHATHFGHS